MTVADVDVVDLITHENDTDRVKLVAVMTDPWDGSVAQLRQVLQKIQHYADYITTGQLVQDQPTMDGKRPVIQLSVFAPPPPAIAAALEQVAATLGPEIDFQTEQLSPPAESKGFWGRRRT